MPRGYRCILVAFVGWLALSGASPPEHRGPTRKADSHQTVPKPSTATDQSKYQPYPNKDADACYKAQDHDAADLCAQWRAAVAAEHAASASGTANYIAAAGALLTFISICLLIWTLVQTQRATKAAEDSAKAAREALGSDRAWICGDGVDSGPVTNSHLDSLPIANGFAFITKWRNFGVTPAFNIKVFRDFVLIDPDGPIPAFGPGPDDDETAAVAGPNVQFAGHPAVLNDAETADFRGRRKKVVLYSRVTYRDKFSPDVERVSECCYVAIHQGGQREQNGVRTEAISIQAAGGQNTAT
jgi:hypothetical protein